MSNTQFNYDRSFDLGEWVKTDDLQYVKKVSFEDDYFKYITIDTFEFADKIIIKRQNIDFNLFDEEVESSLDLYGYDDIKTLFSTYEEQTPSVIAEILSEINIFSSGDIVGEITSDEDNIVEDFDEIVNWYINDNNL